MPAIVVEDLHMAYGPREVLRGVNLTADAGECLALLGPNGAGKTTAVEILEGHRRRTRGHVEVLGVDPGAGGAAFRDRIGIVLQEAGIEGDLRAGEVLRLFAGYYSRPRSVRELLDLVGLSDAVDRPVKTLSGGQRRRLDLALGLVGRPEIAFLDEPTTGFDPAARRSAWAVVAGLKAAGTTVVLTTHYLEEAHALADRVAVLVDGRIVADGPPWRLAGDGPATIRFTVPVGTDPASMPVPIDDVTVASTGSAASPERRAVVARSPNPEVTLRTILGWAGKRGIALDELTVTRPTLEDAYLRLLDRAEPGD